MNTYDEFKINLMLCSIDNLTEEESELIESELIEFADLLESFHLTENTDIDQLNEFKSIIKKTATRIGAGIKAKVTKHRKKDVSGVKSLKSKRGPGGTAKVTIQRAGERIKKSINAVRRHAKTSASKYKKIAKKAGFTKTKKGTFTR